MTQMVYVTEGLYALAILACPIGMGLMMWFMMRGNKQPDRQQPQPGPDTRDTDPEVVRLRAELDQLRAAARDRETPPPAGSNRPH